MGTRGSPGQRTLRQKQSHVQAMRPKASGWNSSERATGLQPDRVLQKPSAVWPPGRCWGFCSVHTQGACEGLTFFPLELQNHRPFLLDSVNLAAFHFCAPVFNRRIWQNTYIPILHWKRSVCMDCVSLWAEKPYKLLVVPWVRREAVRGLFTGI